MPASLPDAPIAGKYEVHGILGEGGTGIVYDAVRTSDGLPVALKVIHPALAGDQQVRGRFQREAAILSRLEGPNICPILELGEVPAEVEGKTSLLYMALAKLEGPTLETVLHAERPIPVERGLDIMLEVLDALRTAHAQGVIHRDLKPANVILEGGSRVVVVDFGMSKIITGAAGHTTTLTAHNMVFGTPEYMSPEQARGDELDERCDVYAAGIMVYEMLTGAPPFTGKTPLSVLTEHLSGEITPPSKRAKEVGRVSPALESVVLYALARDKDHRYPSASALAAAIRHARAMPDDVLSLRPVAFGSAPPGTEAYAATMPHIAARDSEEPTSDRVPSDTLLATGPPLPLAPSLAPPTKRSATTIPVARDTSRPFWIAAWIIGALASIAIGVYFALR